MASMLNFWNCFSETSPTGKFVCDGDVCVLRKDRSAGACGSKKKQGSFRIPFVRRSSVKTDKN
ncbi:hypothetical protein HanRHA438_Chr03g0129531 [Helianthus annuus]|nr:hypothetical protein HanIR_Chr03g0128841 [Helianthus annuus]KAJ0936326.1 hypothetical protein HanRHA438_Chr03g0129531 [Helianthus annuus]